MGVLGGQRVIRVMAGKPLSHCLLNTQENWVEDASGLKDNENRGCRERDHAGVEV